MAAPSGTAWGSIYGDYARLGFYITHSATNTAVTTTVQVWLWTKWSVSDTVNTFYYDNLASSGSASTNRGAVSISTTVNSSWSTSNQVLLTTYTHTHNKTTSAQTRYIYAALSTVEVVGATIYASTSYTVDRLAYYTVSYNANGGSGAPSAQTKWYGTNIALSTVKPTRTGYTFQGWSTSASGGVVYASGATYSSNANITLYAVWKANTYTVSYNANGGSGAPGAQTKTYGVNLTLSSTKPTRTNYNFKGWSTSATGGVVYAAGGTYTANSGVTLYAVWELAYVKPTLSISTVARCTSNGTVSDSGTYIKAAFSWTTYYASTNIIVYWKSSTDTSWSAAYGTKGSTSGSENMIVGNGTIDIEKTYTVRICIVDKNGSTEMDRSINSMSLPIDVLAGGTGVSIGKVADKPNTLEVAWPIRASAINHTIGYEYYSQGWFGHYPTHNDAMNNSNRQWWIGHNGKNHLFITNEQKNGYVAVSHNGTGVGLQVTYNGGFYYAALQRQVVLWSGSRHMNANQTATLSERISDQQNGIVLVFSYYNNSNSTVDDSYFHTVFVPKCQVARHNSRNYIFSYAYNGTFGGIAIKHLFIGDTTITGMATNGVSGTANGTPYYNSYSVLRYVYGV